MLRTQRRSANRQETASSPGDNEVERGSAAAREGDKRIINAILIATFLIICSTFCAARWMGNMYKYKTSKQIKINKSIFTWCAERVFVCVYEIFICLFWRLRFCVSGTVILASIVRKNEAKCMETVRAIKSILCSSVLRLSLPLVFRCVDCLLKIDLIFFARRLFYPIECVFLSVYWIVGTTAQCFSIH